MLQQEDKQQPPEQPPERKKSGKNKSSFTHYQSPTEESLRNLVHFGSLVLRLLRAYVPPQQERYAQQPASEEERRLIQHFNGTETYAVRTNRVSLLVEQYCMRLNQARSEDPERETNANEVRSSLYHVLAYQQEKGLMFSIDPLRVGSHPNALDDILQKG